MDRLKALEIFREVARTASFTKAALSLGLSKGSVTKHITWLEDGLSANLFNRTTTKVVLTELGASVLERANALLSDYEDMENEARTTMSGARGLVRLGAPALFVREHILPILAEFNEAHPAICVSVIDNLRVDNFLGQGLDVSLQIATSLKDSSFIGFPMVTTPQLLVASPEYIARHGQPQHPKDLAHHTCMVHTLKNETSTWRFTGPDGVIGVKVQGWLNSNAGTVVKEAVLRGYGIGLHPYYVLKDDLSQGRLIPIMADYVPENLEIHIVYPTKKNIPKRVGLFIDFLKKRTRQLRADVDPQPS